MWNFFGINLNFCIKDKNESISFRFIPITVAPKGEEQCCGDKSDLSNYLRDPEFKYKDFAKRGEESKLPTFRAQVCDQTGSLYSVPLNDPRQLMVGIAYHYTVQEGGHSVWPSNGVGIAYHYTYDRISLHCTGERGTVSDHQMELLNYTSGIQHWHPKSSNCRKFIEPCW